MQKALPNDLLNSVCDETPGLPNRLSREPVRILALKAGFTEAGLVALPYEG